MDIIELSEFFKQAFLISFGFLVVWLVMMGMLKDWIYEFHSKFLNLSREQFDGAQYLLMGYFKLSIFIFFLIPYLAIMMMN